LPAQITVRIIRFTATIRGFRSRRITLVTTLLDPKLYPAEELAALYARRWGLELCLRDLKTTLGMEELRCKTPRGGRKGIIVLLGPPQSHSLCHGRSGWLSSGGFGADEFQRNR
jgi:hypothetical protein